MRIPFKSLDPANSPLFAVNEAKKFGNFSLEGVGWLPADDPDGGRRAVDAVGLGVIYSAIQGRPAVDVIPISSGLMSYHPSIDSAGNVVQGTLRIRFSDRDLDLFRRTDPCWRGLAELSFLYVVPRTRIDELFSRLNQHRADGNFVRQFNPLIDVSPNVMFEQNAVVAESAEIHLRSWFNGDSWAFWSFRAGFPLADSGLFELDSEVPLVIYAEIRYQFPDGKLSEKYRINPGFVLDRLRRQLGETTLDDNRVCSIVTEGFCDLVASGTEELGSRNEAVVVTGGSLKPNGDGSPAGSIILQPTGVVPPCLFSFITSDEIRLHSLRLTPEARVRVTVKDPCLANAEVEALWRSIRSREMVRPNSAYANAGYFRAAFYSEAVTVPRGVSVGAMADLRAPLRTDARAFYPSVARAVRYDFTDSWKAGVFNSWEECELAVIPHEEASTRPAHPAWRPQQALQLKRSYPIRYRFEIVADAAVDLTASMTNVPEAYVFEIAQDDMDCARQEYAFHLSWERRPAGADYYFQVKGPRENWNHPADRPTRYRVGDEWRPELVSQAGSIHVTERSDLRNLTRFEESGDNFIQEFVSVYRPVTMFNQECLTRFWEVRQKIFENARILEAFLAEPRNVTEAGIDGLPFRDYLKEILKHILVRIPLAIEERRQRWLTDPPAQAAVADVNSSLGILSLIYDPATGIGGALDPVARFRDWMNGIVQPNIGLPERSLLHLLRGSSSWRPPEHNETSSKTIKSNHQSGWALDIQPYNPDGLRNPIAMAMLHDYAETALRAGILGECLLELKAEELVVSRFDMAYKDYPVRPTYGADGKITGFQIHAIDLVEYDPDHPPEDKVIALPGDVRLPHVNLGRRFVDIQTEWLEKHHVEVCVQWPNPAPTFMEFVVFALVFGSHTHHTFKQGSRMPGF